MGDEETMKMLMGENLRIMVGGQVVGMAKEAKFSIAEDDASTKEKTREGHPMRVLLLFLNTN